MKDKPFQLWLSSQDSVPHDTSCSALKLAASFIREKIQYVQIDISSFILFLFESFSTIKQQRFFRFYLHTTVVRTGKRKFFETCQRTSDFCRVVFFVTPRLCGLFPNASVNETTQSLARFHPCLYPTTYCACRSQAGVRGRHSYNYLRTENLYCSLC